MKYSLVIVFSIIFMIFSVVGSKQFSSRDDCALTKKSCVAADGSICNGHGACDCGECHCHAGYNGKHCETCELPPKIAAARCNSIDTGLTCSGRGVCVCGRCQCNKRENPSEIISGRQCECDNFSCDRYQAEICGGPERGVCECGRCVCKENYLGDNCGSINCTIAQTDCIGVDGSVCNGHGICDCGLCVCDIGYIGKYCENSCLAKHGNC